MQRYFYNGASTPEWPVTRGIYARSLDASRRSELKIGIERLKIGLPADVRTDMCGCGASDSQFRL